MLRGCSQLELCVPCRQFRSRDCRECVVRLFTSGAVIEASTGMRFAPWNAGYAGLTAQLVAANMQHFIEQPRLNNFDKCASDP